jgi:hypothetical protein
MLNSFLIHLMQIDPDSLPTDCLIRHQCGHRHPAGHAFHSLPMQGVEVDLNFTGPILDLRLLQVEPGEVECPMIGKGNQYQIHGDIHRLHIPDIHTVLTGQAICVDIRYTL